MDDMKDSFERVVNTQIEWSSVSLQLIQEMWLEIDEATKIIQSVTYSEHPSGHRTVLTKLKDKLLNLDSLCCIEGLEEVMMHAELHQKILEESLIPDMMKAYRNLEYDSRFLNQTIIKHLYREGMFDVVDCFKKETHEPDTIPLRWQFEQSRQILKALESRDIEPALQWVSDKGDILKDAVSSFKLNLHKMKFVDMVEKASTDALQYAKTNIAPLVSLSEAQRLFRSILWAGRLHESPDTDPTSLKKLTEEFLHMLCKVTEQPYREHLSTVVTAGMEAMPTLLELADVAAAQGEDWQTMKELIYTLPLRDKYRFHLILACIACYDECSKDNPPKLLQCGHFLCSNCIVIYVVHLDATTYVRCPFCRDKYSQLDRCRQLQG